MEESGFKVPTHALGKRRRQENESSHQETEDSSTHGSTVEEGSHDGGSSSISDGGAMSEVAGEDRTKESPAPEREEPATVEGEKDTTSSSKDGEPQNHAHLGSAPPLPYTVPHWSGDPGGQPFSLSVIKNGRIIEEIDISQKPYVVFGRLPSCDVQFEHPSVSRYHAVLQYLPHRNHGDGEEEGDKAHSHSTLFSGSVPQEAGHYVYDLGSTHGTTLNKTKINPRCYCRVRVGQMIKFGGSSRLFLLEVG